MNCSISLEILSFHIFGDNKHKCPTISDNTVVYVYIRISFSDKLGLEIHEMSFTAIYTQISVIQTLVNYSKNTSIILYL